jgi:hypothetical protein
MIKYPLHCFGDSFTCGTELVDYKYVQNYPSYLGYNDWSKLPASQRQRPPIDQSNIKKIEMEEHQNSYVGLLGGVNHGIAGCSLQTIQRLVIDHLEHSRSKNIIVIQPTGIERWSEYVHDKWKDYIGGVMSQDAGDLEKQYLRFRLSNSTQFSNLLLWHNCLLTLIEYVKSHRNTADYWIINNGSFNEITTLLGPSKISDPMLQNTLTYLKDKTINFPQVEDMQYPYFCIGGHVNIEAHKELAQRLQFALSRYYR